LTVTADGAPEGVLVERIEYLSDGLRVVGYRAAPTVGGNLPVVIENRGGNRDFGQWTDASAVGRLGRMAGWGYLVLASQYRGVDGGEGREEFGGADVNDVLSLLPVVESDPRADTARIGMVGWSRGGMTTYLVLRRTNRIKAAVLGSAIADLFQTAENRPPMEQNVFSELIPDYWETREQALTDRSAIYWVDQLPKQTPLLLLQGSADWRVEPTQTLRMAAALFEAMHPFRLVFFEGGDHGLTEYRTEVDDLTRHWLDTYVRDRQPWPSLEPHGN
jgi:dipeptidyl aminopeptidase/acylaminoacyl peptidase